jgi:Exonuclease VII, large subunit
LAESPSRDCRLTLFVFNTKAELLHPGPISIETLNQQIRSTVVRVLYHSFHDAERQVVVRGIIGDIPATDYRVCYRVPLRDAGQVVYLDIPRQLLTSRCIETGDYVQVIGVLSVDDGQNQSSRVDIRITVSDVERIDRPRDAERLERTTLEYLKRLRPAISQFPTIDSIKISVIHPVSEQSRVQGDFQQQLMAAQHLHELELIRVPMNNADEIAGGIRQATGNVLVLIRGGGDPADFDVFDQKPVIDAWGGKKAFKALGLGHEGTGATLLDFISDYVGSTPTAVGGFLAQQMLKMEKRRQHFEAVTGRSDALDQENRELKSELARACEEREMAVQRAAGAKRQQQKLLIAAAFLLGVIFAVGLIIGYRWAH